MSKFHINKKGVPAPCRATTRPCPLGGEDVHFNSIEEAQKHLDNENKNKYNLLPKNEYISGETISELAETIPANIQDIQNSISNGKLKFFSNTEDLKAFMKVRVYSDTLQAETIDVYQLNNGFAVDTSLLSRKKAPENTTQIKTKLDKKDLEELTDRLGKSWRKSDGSPDEQMIKHCLKDSKYIKIGDSFVDIGTAKPTIYKDIFYDDETTPPDLSLESFKEYNLKMRGDRKLSLTGRNRDGYGKLKMIPQYAKNRGLELTSLTYEDDDGMPSREITESELAEINKTIDEVTADYEKRLEKYYSKYKNKISFVGYYANR